MMSVPLQCSALLVREEVGLITFNQIGEYSSFSCWDNPKYSGSDFTGSDAELQPDARLLPLPAGQTLRPVLRHRRQSAAVWTTRGHLQAVAHVESQGNLEIRRFFETQTDFVVDRGLQGFLLLISCFNHHIFMSNVKVEVYFVFYSQKFKFKCS